MDVENQKNVQKLQTWYFYDGDGLMKLVFSGYSLHWFLLSVHIRIICGSLPELGFLQV